MKNIKKEIVIAIAVALTIALLSIFYNNPPQNRKNYGTQTQSAGTLSGPSIIESEPSDRVQIMDADIYGKLKNGTFETVIPSIEALTREKGGFIVTESMTLQDGLWSGEIISKLPPTSASSFTIAVRQKIDEYGQVDHIQIDIREFNSQGGTVDSGSYSTVKTFLREELDERKTPGPIIQLLSGFPILVTGLVWIAEGLIIGVPLCFASLGIVMLVKRVIIPLWKNELRKSV